jgi:DNA-binding beta-propeller fold protein YncE
MARFICSISFSPNAMKRLWFIVLSTFTISFGFLVAPLRAQLVYVSNTGSNNISGYEIFPSKTGILSSIQVRSFFVPLHRPVSVAADPKGHFLYVANEDDGIQGYRIVPTGVLAPILPTVPTGGHDPFSIAVERFCTTR